nr:PEGA domain-containing protein [Deltaproteobacteria bacterium]
MPWGRGLAVVASVSLAVFASPVLAQPDDEIEMEPDAGSGSGSAPKPPAPKPPAPKPPTPVPAPADKPVDPPATDPPPDGQPPPVVKDPKLAKKVATTAVQATQKGDLLTRQKKPDDAKLSYEAAVTAYLKAIELGDDVNLYYDLAIVEEKLGKLDVAATHWRVVTKAPPANVRPDILKKATAKFDEVSTKVGLLTFVVKPDGATISLDNVEIAKSPLALPLILMPNTYKFQLAADGYQLKDIEVTVEAGSESERGIDLEPIKIVIDTRPPPVDDTPRPPPPTPPSKLPLIVGASATVGFLAVSTITGLVAMGKHSKFTAAETSNFDRELAAYDGKNFARVADVALVATVAAAGFTASWYFFKYRPAQRKLRVEPARTSRNPSDEPQRTKASVLPWVKADGGGLSFG